MLTVVSAATTMKTSFSARLAMAKVITVMLWSLLQPTLALIHPVSENDRTTNGSNNGAFIETTKNSVLGYGGMVSDTANNSQLPFNAESTANESMDNQRRSMMQMSEQERRTGMSMEEQKEFQQLEQQMSIEQKLALTQKLSEKRTGMPTSLVDYARLQNPDVDPNLIVPVKLKDENGNGAPLFLTFNNQKRKEWTPLYRKNGRYHPQVIISEKNHENNSFLSKVSRLSTQIGHGLVHAASQTRLGRAWSWISAVHEYILWDLNRELVEDALREKENLGELIEEPVQNALQRGGFSRRQLEDQQNPIPNQQNNSQLQYTTASEPIFNGVEYYVRKDLGVVPQVGEPEPKASMEQQTSASSIGETNVSSQLQKIKELQHEGQSKAGEDYSSNAYQHDHRYGTGRVLDLSKISIPLFGRYRFGLYKTRFKLTTDFFTAFPDQVGIIGNWHGIYLSSIYHIAYILRWIFAIFPGFPLAFFPMVIDMFIITPWDWLRDRAWYKYWIGSWRRQVIFNPILNYPQVDYIPVTAGFANVKPQYKKAKGTEYLKKEDDRVYEVDKAEATMVKLPNKDKKDGNPATTPLKAKPGQLISVRLDRNQQHMKDYVWPFLGFLRDVVSFITLPMSPWRYKAFIDVYYRHQMERIHKLQNSLISFIAFPLKFLELFQNVPVFGWFLQASLGQNFAKRWVWHHSYMKVYTAAEEMKYLTLVDSIDVTAFNNSNLASSYPAIYNVMKGFYDWQREEELKLKNTSLLNGFVLTYLGVKIIALGIEAFIYPFSKIRADFKEEIPGKIYSQVMLPAIQKVKEKFVQEFKKVGEGLKNAATSGISFIADLGAGVFGGKTGNDASIDRMMRIQKKFTFNKSTMTDEERRKKIADQKKNGFFGGFKNAGKSVRKLMSEPAAEGLAALGRSGTLFRDFLSSHSLWFLAQVFQVCSIPIMIPVWGYMVMTLGKYVMWCVNDFSLPETYGLSTKETLQVFKMAPFMAKIILFLRFCDVCAFYLKKMWSSLQEPRFFERVDIKIDTLGQPNTLDQIRIEWKKETPVKKNSQGEFILSKDQVQNALADAATASGGYTGGSGAPSASEEAAGGGARLEARRQNLRMYDSGGFARSPCNENIPRNLSWLWTHYNSNPATQKLADKRLKEDINKVFRQVIFRWPFIKRQFFDRMLYGNAAVYKMERAERKRSWFSGSEARSSSAYDRIFYQCSGLLVVLSILVNIMEVVYLATNHCGEGRDEAMIRFAVSGLWKCVARFLFVCGGGYVCCGGLSILTLPVFRSHGLAEDMGNRNVSDVLCCGLRFSNLLAILLKIVIKLTYCFLKLWSLVFLASRDCCVCILCCSRHKCEDELDLDQCIMGPQEDEGINTVEYMVRRRSGKWVYIDCPLKSFLQVIWFCFTCCGACGTSEEDVDETDNNMFAVPDLEAQFKAGLLKRSDMPCYGAQYHWNHASNVWNGSPYCCDFCLFTSCLGTPPEKEAGCKSCWRCFCQLHTFFCSERSLSVAQDIIASCFWNLSVGHCCGYCCGTWPCAQYDCCCNVQPGRHPLMCQNKQDPERQSPNCFIRICCNRKCWSCLCGTESCGESKSCCFNPIAYCIHGISSFVCGGGWLDCMWCEKDPDAKKNSHEDHDFTNQNLTLSAVPTLKISVPIASNKIELNRSGVSDESAAGPEVGNPEKNSQKEEGIDGEVVSSYEAKDYGRAFLKVAKPTGSAKSSSSSLLDLICTPDRAKHIRELFSSIREVFCRKGSCSIGYCLVTQMWNPCIESVVREMVREQTARDTYTQAYLKAKEIEMKHNSRRIQSLQQKYKDQNEVANLSFNMEHLEEATALKKILVLLVMVLPDSWSNCLTCCYVSKVSCCWRMFQVPLACICTCFYPTRVISQKILVKVLPETWSNRLTKFLACICTCPSDIGSSLFQCCLCKRCQSCSTENPPSDNKGIPPPNHETSTWEWYNYLWCDHCTQMSNTEGENPAELCYKAMGKFRGSVMWKEIALLCMRFSIACGFYGGDFDTGMLSTIEIEDGIERDSNPLRALPFQNFILWCRQKGVLLQACNNCFGSCFCWCKCWRFCFPKSPCFQWMCGIWSYCCCGIGGWIDSWSDEAKDTPAAARIKDLVDRIRKEDPETICCNYDLLSTWAKSCSGSCKFCCTRTWRDCLNLCFEVEQPTNTYDLRIDIGYNKQAYFYTLLCYAIVVPIIWFTVYQPSNHESNYELLGHDNDIIDNASSTLAWFDKSYLYGIGGILWNWIAEKSGEIPGDVNGVKHNLSDAKEFLSGKFNNAKQAINVVSSNDVVKGVSSSLSYSSISEKIEGRLPPPIGNIFQCLLFCICIPCNSLLLFWSLSFSAVSTILWIYSWVLYQANPIHWHFVKRLPFISNHFPYHNCALTIIFTVLYVLCHKGDRRNSQSSSRRHGHEINRLHEINISTCAWWVADFGNKLADKIRNFVATIGDDKSPEERYVAKVMQGKLDHSLSGCPCLLHRIAWCNCKLPSDLREGFEPKHNKNCGDYCRTLLGFFCHVLCCLRNCWKSLCGCDTYCCRRNCSRTDTTDRESICCQLKNLQCQCCGGRNTFCGIIKKFCFYHDAKGFFCECNTEVPDVDVNIFVDDGRAELHRLIDEEKRKKIEEARQDIFMKIHKNNKDGISILTPSFQDPKEAMVQKKKIIEETYSVSDFANATTTGTTNHATTNNPSITTEESKEIKRIRQMVIDKMDRLTEIDPLCNYCTCGNFLSLCSAGSHSKNGCITCFTKIATLENTLKHSPTFEVCTRIFCLSFFQRFLWCVNTSVHCYGICRKVCARGIFFWFTSCCTREKETSKLKRNKNKIVTSLLSATDEKYTIECVVFSDCYRKHENLSCYFCRCCCRCAFCSTRCFPFFCIPNWICKICCDSIARCCYQIGIRTASLLACVSKKKLEEFVRQEPEWVAPELRCCVMDTKTSEMKKVFRCCTVHSFEGKPCNALYTFLYLLCMPFCSCLYYPGFKISRSTTKSSSKSQKKEPSQGASSQDSSLYRNIVSCCYCCGMCGSNDCCNTYWLSWFPNCCFLKCNDNAQETANLFFYGFVCPGMVPLKKACDRCWCACCCGCPTREHKNNTRSQKAVV